MNLVTSWALVAAFVAGCGGAPTAPASAEGGPAAPPPGDGGSPAAGDQVSKGAALYAAQCADCHGEKGEGAGKAPALVGKAALPLDAPAGSARKSPFKTAADVIAFVQATMPPKKAGSLTDEQASSIVAFALQANGVDMTGKTIDRQSASAIVLHP